MQMEHRKRYEDSEGKSIQCRYTGTDPSMLITNAIFRMGGAAILLSNRSGFATMKFQMEKDFFCYFTSKY